MVEPAPPWISKLLGGVGIAAILLIGLVHSFLILTDRDYSSPYWGSLWPVVTVVVITAIVGIACYLDIQNASEPDRGLRTYRPFFWCLGLTVAYYPAMFFMAIISYGIDGD